MFTWLQIKESSQAPRKNCDQPHYPVLQILPQWHEIIRDMQPDHSNKDKTRQGMQPDHLNRKGLSESPDPRTSHHCKKQEVEKRYKTTFFQARDQALPGMIAPCFFNNP